jgi:hypothetical protein
MLTRVFFFQRAKRFRVFPNVMHRLSVRWRPANRSSVTARSVHRCAAPMCHSYPPPSGLLTSQRSRTLAAMSTSLSVSLRVKAEVSRKAARAHNSQASNPFIERTNNSGRRLLASSRSAALLFAAHVER